MKKQARIGIIIAVVAVVLILSTTYVVSSPGNNGDCGSSGCHTDASGITITPSSTSFEVLTDGTFNLNIQVVGVAGESFTVKFPSQVASNAEFDYGSLGNDGQVDDGDPADSNTAIGQVEVDYEITAPSDPGTFFLEFHAAQTPPNGASITITVEVIQTGDAPIISNINTSVPIPLPNEDVIVSSEISSEEGLDSAVLQYSLDNGTTWANVTMELEGGRYQGTIPGQPLNTYVTYRIVATDILGNERISSERGYRVGDIPPEPLPVLHYGFYLGFPALVLAYLGTALEYYDEERFTKIHGIMLGAAYILTSINVISLFAAEPTSWTALDPVYLFDFTNVLRFNHSWHIWLGIISMILGTLAFITHLGGWKTCNLGLPAVLIWTILGIQGVYLGMFFKM